MTLLLTPASRTGASGSGEVAHRLHTPLFDWKRFPFIRFRVLAIDAQGRVFGSEEFAF